MAFGRELKENHYKDDIKTFTTFIWGLREDSKKVFMQTGTNY